MGCSKSSSRKFTAIRSYLEKQENIEQTTQLYTYNGWKKIQPVHPEGDNSWVFIGRTAVEVLLQYFGHLMQRVDSLEKTLMLGGIGGRRRRER